MNEAQALSASEEKIKRAVDERVSATVKQMAEEMQKAFDDHRTKVQDDFEAAVAGLPAAAPESLASLLSSKQRDSYRAVQAKTVERLKAAKDDRERRRAVNAEADAVNTLLTGKEKRTFHIGRTELILEGVAVAATVVVATVVTGEVLGRRQLRKAGRTKAELAAFLKPQPKPLDQA